MILANLVYLYLPLTIWFVLVCTMPFSLGLLSYIFMGEGMAPVSIVAAILSFGAILILFFAKPSTTDDSDEVAPQKESYNF